MTVAFAVVNFECAWTNALVLLLLLFSFNRK